MQQTLNLTPDRNTKPHWSNAWPSSSDDPPHVPLLLLNTKFDLICWYSQILCFLAKTLDMWHLYTQISIEGAKKVSTATGNFYGNPEFKYVLLQAYTMRWCPKIDKYQVCWWPFMQRFIVKHSTPKSNQPLVSLCGELYYSTAAWRWLQMSMTLGWYDDILSFSLPLLQRVTIHLVKGPG